MTKWSRGVGALLLELPHRETAPAAPLIDTPLLCHTDRAKKRLPIRGAKKEEKKIRVGGEERRTDMEREKKKNKKVGERREKQQSINYLNRTN